MLFVKGISADGCIFYFHIQQDNKLQPYTPSGNLLQNLVTVPVRVIAKSGKKRQLDPQPSIVELWDMLLLYARQPVSRLMWDLGGWFWTSPMMDPLHKVPFFQYTMKFGRTLLMSKNIPTPAAQKHWNKWGVSSNHLKAYWKWIWSFRGPTKYIILDGFYYISQVYQ